MITPAAPLVAGFHHMSTRPRSVPVQRSHLSVVGALSFCVRDPRSRAVRSSLTTPRRSSTCPRRSHAVGFGCGDSLGHKVTGALGRGSVLPLGLPRRQLRPVPRRQGPARPRPQLRPRATVAARAWALAASRSDSASSTSIRADRCAASASIWAASESIPTSADAFDEAGHARLVTGRRRAATT